MILEGRGGEERLMNIGNLWARVCLVTGKNCVFRRAQPWQGEGKLLAKMCAESGRSVTERIMEKAQTELHRAGHCLYFSILCIQHTFVFGIDDIKGLFLPK